jgi:hypothetical protein
MANKMEDKLSEISEIQAIQDACTALSLPNQKRVYEVACALKFAEEKPVTAAGASDRIKDSGKGRDMTGGNSE